MTLIQIVQATTQEQIQHVIDLASEYVTWMIETLQTTYIDVDTTPFIQAHAYEDLKARFPGEYVPPQGRLFLAYQNQQPSGCIAVARWTDTICEVQTLFVRPDYRGLGIAKLLVKQAIQSAHDIGYSKMRLDTLAFMTGAQTLYQSFGFNPIDAYRQGAGDIQKYIRFFELELNDNSKQ